MRKFRKLLSLVLAVVMVCAVSVTAFAEDISPFTIFGKDDRVKVSNTTASPYSAVCNLTIKWSDKTTTYGTGFLITPTRVATAAHCMYNYKKGISVSSIKIVPGDTPSSDPYKSQTIIASSSFVYPDDYKTSGSYVDDYGYIDLPYSFSGSPTTLPLYENSDLTGNTATIIGYDYKTANMWKCTKSIEEDNGYRILHKMDTLVGMSGSPVLDINNRVVAINNYSVDGQLPPNNTTTDDYPDSNKATKITQTVYDFLTQP